MTERAYFVIAAYVLVVAIASAFTGRYVIAVASALIGGILIHYGAEP